MRFTEGITPEELQDGWLSRCLVFRVHNIPRKNRNNCDLPPPDNLCEQVKAWYTRQIGTTIGDFVQYGTALDAQSKPPQQIVVPTARGANELFLALDDESFEVGTHHPELACLWRKAEENARKIALIVAAGVSFEQPEITDSIADYACHLIRCLLIAFGRDTAHQIVANKIAGEKQKLLKIISEHGVAGCVQRAISRRSQHLNQKERNNLLADMIDAGIIAAVSGNRTTRYWVANDYCKYLEKQNAKT